MASSTGSTSNILGPNGTSNFMSGLASGLDTEDMVEKLLSGTQAKIDKQNAKKQQVEWKQEIYRDIITKINGFQDKYFSFFGTGNTNLLSSSFYNVMTANSTNSAVKVVSATSKAPSNLVINQVSQLATATRGESKNPVTGSLGMTIKPNSDGTLADFSYDSDNPTTYSFDMSLDGVRKTIKFQGAASKADLISNINSSISRVFGETVQIDAGTGEVKCTYETDKKDQNGNVELDSEGNPIKERKEDNSHRVIFYNTTDSSDETTVRDGVLEKLGLKNGASNKLDYNTYLNDIPFVNKVQGKNFTFKINGTEIKASSEDTLGDVINRINNSEAEVKVTYSSVTDKFIIESANTGADIDITMEQSEGNLLTAMFGIEGGNQTTGTLKGSIFKEKTTVSGDVSETALSELLKNAESKSQTLSFYLVDPDGHEDKYTISIPKKKYEDETKLKEEINNQLKEKFGTVKSRGNNVNTGEPDEVPIVALTLSDDKKTATIKTVLLDDDEKKAVPEKDAKKSYKIRFTADNEDSTLAGVLGFTKYDGETKLSDLGVQGKIRITNSLNVATREIELGNQSINKLVEDLGYRNERKVSFDETTGRISIEGGLDKVRIEAADEAADNLGKDAMKTLFGTQILQKECSGVKFEAGTKGTNAVLTVNGTTNSDGKITGGTVIERNTNSFELDGITMELTAVTADGAPPISLTTSKDTDKIVEGLKSFVDDYNALIEELNDQVNAEASYMKYPPLTDAQKKEMSDREIEKWEEKSKEGLLRNDSNISKFLLEMRTAMYQTVESAGLALYDIGIESSSNYRDNGKLVLDESKLKSALSTKLDDIQKMFTDKDNGLAVQLQNALKAAANPSSGSPGSLVRYAGTKDVMITSNTLYYEMKSITETLSRLNTKYETERTRYWKQFTAMEQAISKMNSQSSWMTQQFS